LISSLYEKVHTQKWLPIILLMVFLYTGCKQEELIQRGDSLKVAYQKSMKLYETEHYQDATKAFQTVIKSGRGTDYARGAQYFLAQSYFKSGQYLLAANAYNTFLSLYPQSPKEKASTFKEALSYYKLSPRYDISQKNTRKAIQKFKLFISRYPNSDRADQAGKYITKMRTKLAHKMFNAAQLYDRLNQYKAAVIYYNSTVDKYPDTHWAEQALVKEIATYVEYADKSVPSSKRKRYNKAVSTYEKYVQLFPHGEHRQEAKAKVKKAKAALVKMESSSNKKATAANQ
jgi:outer membrane protein assembly factor BamD